MLRQKDQEFRVRNKTTNNKIATILMSVSYYNVYG